MPFTLAAGNYSIAWQGRGSGNCIGRLTSTVSRDAELFLNVIVKDPQRGETQVYAVKQGQYYLDMSCDDWAVAIAPQGQDALAALDTAPVPAASQAAAAPAAAVEWALAFDRIEPLTQAAVANEYGSYRRQVATGVFQRIFFRIQNRQKKSDTISASELTLTDAQGRTYSTDFQVRQVQGASSAAFDGVSIVPDATVALIVVFDVTPNANGLVLHMRGGNDVKVN